MRQAWQAEDYATLKTSRNALRGMKEQRDALVARVVPLAKTYREVLIDLGEESQSYVEQWRKHGREMLADWQRQHPDADIPPRLLWGAMKQWGIRKAGKKAAAIRFMLWDGSGDLGEAQPKAGEFNPLTPDDDAPELTAAPNPFADGTHIRLTLPADQTITLAVYDGAGRRLAVLAEGFFTKGDHSFPYRADASGGQYARLDAGGATRTIALNTTK